MDPIGNAPYQDSCAEDANAQSCSQDLRSTVRQGPYLRHGREAVSVGSSTGRIVRASVPALR